MVFKHSITYTKMNPNFIIYIPKCRTKKAVDNSSVFSVLKNIINRSCYIAPTTYLKSRLGELKPLDGFKYYPCVDDLKWDKTIKGSDDKNPALEFYQKHLIKSLRKSKFLRNSFIPELEISEIVISDNPKIKESFIDFYSPQLRCAIEIDGIQHKELANSLMDKERNKILFSEGINIIRIDSTNIKEVNKDILTLAGRFDYSKYTQDYDKEIMNYDAVIRYEMLLLDLLENGCISIDDDVWKLSIEQNEELDSNLIEIAAKDILLWINNINTLLGLEHKNPKIEIINVDDKEALCIDLNLKRYYDEEISDDKIYVRNDYFEYEKDANISYQRSIKNYIYSKNYYKVCNGNIKYQTQNRTDEQKKALAFILNEVFSFSKFLPNQEDIIFESLEKGSVIGLLPTGAGKSLCYQFLSMLLPGVTLVVSPLKVLMKDQYIGMTEKYGIDNVCFINSSNKQDTDIIKYNQSKITLISPERFFNDEFLEILKSPSMQISLVAIDEVHCLSEWGHDFRTSYLCLTHYLRDNLQRDCKLLGLTATASPRVLEDITIEFNNFKGYTEVIQSTTLARKNLSLYVKKFKYEGDSYERNSKYKELLNLYTDKEELNTKTIVFTKTKSSSKWVKDSCYNLSIQIKKDLEISDNSINYFASSSSDRNENSENDEKLEEFRKGETNLLFATKAFGMGVDIPDIRRTIHFALPSSIESLYQEFGRAGRDNKPANCHIWYYNEDPNIFNDLFNNAFTIGKIDRQRTKFKEFPTNLYFLTNNTLDIEQEKFFEMYLYNYLVELSKTQINISFTIKDFIKQFEEYVGLYESYDNYKKTISVLDKYVDLYVPKFDYNGFVDKALYRLFLLGRISMWTVKYGVDLKNPTITNIRLTNNSIQDQKEHLLAYIRKYEPEYILKEKASEPLILTKLIEWAFNHFVYQRVQSLKNIYEYCDEYENSDQFMNLIVKYLSNDKITSKLINEPDNYEYWFELLENASLVELKSIISRYLESDDKLVSLNFISGIIRLLLNDFDDTDGKRRLLMAFNTILKYDEIDKKNIITRLFQFIKNNNHKDILVETIISIDDSFIPLIYKVYQNELLEAEIIYKIADNISKLGGKINDKFR